jgi:hyaluronoglucosaminidase
VARVGTTPPATRARRLVLVGTVTAMAMSAAACTGGDDPVRGGGGATTTTEAPGRPELGSRPEPLPVVTPTPRDMRWLGPDVTVPATVTLRLGEGVDDATRGVVTEALEAAGATAVVADGEGAGPPGGGERRLTVDVALLGDADLGADLEAVGLAVPPDLGPEGYALAAVRQANGHDRLVLAGTDAAGAFYAAQTLRQLAGDGAVAGVGVLDRPAMRHRGTIEGFYGSPWTTDERLDLLAFSGRFKLNTYVYAPKDDPFHRDRWREPYPPERLAELARLVEAAQANHVRFTFAVSPGVSICYSARADALALMAKLDALYGQGVRSFSIALDDIDHTRWNCPGDAARFGPPSTAAAGRAQVALVNTVQRQFVAARPGTLPLQMVPTEYRGTSDSDYRRELRTGLDPAVEVMWTGRTVVPPEVTVADASAAAGTFGRRLYLWDNTPVNDYPPTEGRLILAPYARREAGLSGHLTGIVLNPMNQAAASRVQLVGAADFAWNDAAYDPARAQRAAATDLARGDPATTEALLAFFDVENLAPTSLRSGVASQPQAPALAAQLAAFRAAWQAGDRVGAVAGLRPTAERLARAPARIRAHVDPAFAADCAPWLDATGLWGQALVATLDALAARAIGDGVRAYARFADADGFVARARAIHTVPGETRPQGPVRVADGVLDTFLAGARSLA